MGKDGWAPADSRERLHYFQHQTSNSGLGWWHSLCGRWMLVGEGGSKVGTKPNRKHCPECDRLYPIKVGEKGWPG